MPFYEHLGTNTLNFILWKQILPPQKQLGLQKRNCSIRGYTALNASTAQDLSTVCSLSPGLQFIVKRWVTYFLAMFTV